MKKDDHIGAFRSVQRERGARGWTASASDRASTLHIGISRSIRASGWNIRGDGVKHFGVFRYVRAITSSRFGKIRYVSGVISVRRRIIPLGSSRTADSFGFFRCDRVDCGAARRVKAAGSGGRSPHFGAFRSVRSARLPGKRGPSNGTGELANRFGFSRCIRAALSTPNVAIPPRSASPSNVTVRIEYFAAGHLK